MPLPPIPPIDIPGGSTAPDLETAINALIDQRIVSGESRPQSLRLTTEDGSTIDIDFTANTKGIISGGAVTRTGALNYSVAIGSYQVSGKVLSIAAPTAVVCGPPDATNPRFDLIVGDDAGTLSVVPGTPSATPAYPSIAANQAILYVVGVPSAVSSFVDSVVVSQKVDTATIPAVTVNAMGQVLVGGGVIKPTVVTYTSAGAVNLSTTVHCVDTQSLGLPFALQLPDPTANTEIEGVTFSFFDIGGATADNWSIQYTVPPSAPTTIATATADNQIIRITLIAGDYKVG